ncbi:hypothetical protein [Photorhabdus sp. SF281]|uniref:hypothetical protein n=1 Tax=Photorhabdus sp. SF281 TaxID=3459527 RepID=UPI00404441BC
MKFAHQTADVTGETYRYTRDLAGRIIGETDFTGRTIQYQYDNAASPPVTRIINSYAGAIPRKTALPGRKSGRKRMSSVN